MWLQDMTNSTRSFQEREGGLFPGFFFFSYFLVFIFTKATNALGLKKIGWVCSSLSSVFLQLTNRKEVLTALSLYSPRSKHTPLHIPTHCSTAQNTFWTKDFISTTENSLPDSKFIPKCVIFSFHF